MSEQIQIQPFQGQKGVMVQSVTVQKLNKNGGLIEMIPIVLLDVSGSMNQETRSGKSRIQILNEVVKNGFGAIRKFAFSDRFFECFGELQASGSTELVNAFENLPKGKLDLCLLSDGCPTDSEFECIETAKSLGYPVNVMYIGDSGDAGELFMKELAKATGGKAVSVDSLNLTPEKLSEGMIMLLTEQ